MQNHICIIRFSRTAVFTTCRNGPEAIAVTGFRHDSFSPFQYALVLPCWPHLQNSSPSIKSCWRSPLSWVKILPLLLQEWQNKQMQQTFAGAADTSRCSITLETEPPSSAGAEQCFSPFSSTSLTQLLLLLLQFSQSGLVQLPRVNFYKISLHGSRVH